MSDLEVTYKEPLSRKDAAAYLSTLAAALADDGEVELHLGATRMVVHVPGEVRCEIELEVDDGEIEIDVELTWSRSTPGGASSPDAARPAEPTGTGPAGTGPEDGQEDGQEDGEDQDPRPRSRRESRAR